MKLDYLDLYLSNDTEKYEVLVKELERESFKSAAILLGSILLSIILISLVTIFSKGG